MKIPKDSPTQIGQFVELRGRGALGMVEKIYHGWVWVTWNIGTTAPKICSITELKVLDESQLPKHSSQAL